MRNAASEAQVKDQKRKEQREREQQLADMRALLVLPEFRRFMWRYLSVCKVYHSTFTGNSTTFFNEGMRNIGLKLIDDVMSAKPEAYIEMMNEAKQGEM